MDFVNNCVIDLPLIADTRSIFAVKINKQTCIKLTSFTNGPGTETEINLLFASFLLTVAQLVYSDVCLKTKKQVAWEECSASSSLVICMDDVHFNI